MLSWAEELSKGLSGEASCLKDKSRVSPGIRDRGCCKVMRRHLLVCPPLDAHGAPTVPTAGEPHNLVEVLPSGTMK